VSQNYGQNVITIGSRFSNAPNEALEKLGGQEAEVASLAATGMSLEEICERTNLKPDQVWAMLNEALDRVQGVNWSTGPNGDIRPTDAGEIQRPVQGILR